MAGQPFILALLAGALAALPYVAWARGARRPEVPFAGGLAVAALVYVVLAVVAGQPRAVLLEVAGLVVFGLAAFAGARRWPMLLAVGWGTHVVWDLALHPVEASGHAPWWYPVVCIGFDLFVAGFIAATYWRNATDRDRSDRSGAV